jgi:hypothetical protein
MGYRIEYPDGTVDELDEETTRMLYAQAAQEGVSVDIYLRSIMHAEHALMQAGAKHLDALVKRLSNPPRTRRRL